MFALLADIASGETGTADVLFLVAFVVAAVATALYIMAKNVAGACVSAAVGLVALGWVFL